MTPNQVVAYNLARARLYQGWTQEQAGEALEPYLGTRWSVANFSAIERSVDGGRAASSPPMSCSPCPGASACPSASS